MDLFPSLEGLGVGWKWICWAFMGACLCLPALAETNSPALRYAAIYERELEGDKSGALADYRATLSAVDTNDAVLAEKILYRIGVCEQGLGNPEETRKIWKRLVESYPAADATVLNARAALKFLERELDRVVVEGRVMGAEARNPKSGGRGPGSEVRDSVVMAGEWGHEPVILTASGGVFRVERKAGGRSLDGRRYCLVYAEHPFLPFVAMDVLFEKQPAIISGELNLSPPLALSGRVMDTQGRPLRDAMIHVTGFKSETPLPLDSIFPPIVSEASGAFIIPGLPPGLRYVITAEKAGYRMVSAVEKVLPPYAEAKSPGGETCLPVILQSLGEVSIRGRVVDEGGASLQAVVSVWSSPPVSRELARTSTDEDGRFMVRELRENWVVLKVESEKGVPRSIPGIKPMGQDIDVVVKQGGRAQPGQKRGNLPLPNGLADQDAGRQNNPLPPDVPTVSQMGEFFNALRWIRGNPESGEPLRWEELKGRVVVVHFGSAYGEASLRGQYPNEPGMLSQLVKLYGDQGLACVWVVPEGEGKGDPAKVALELYPEVPIAASPGKPAGEAGGLIPPWGMEQGNFVVRRNGTILAISADLPLFKAVKEAVLMP